MVESADFRELYDLARRGELDRPEVWSILVEREMGTRPVVVGEVPGEEAVEVSLAEHEDMIQALAPDRADEPLAERVLPRALRRREHLLDPHALHAAPELLAIDLVAITQEIAWGGVVWEGVDELLRGPGGGGVLGHVEVDDAPAVVGEDDEDEEDAETSGRHGEEVDRDQVGDVVGEERPPGLRGLGLTLRHEPGDGPLGDLDAELQKLSVDARGPQRGFAAAIFLTRLAISALTQGRPPVGRRESRVQYWRNRRRCHRRTVAGVTITSACLHPVQTLARAAQNRRSAWWSFGRGVIRL